MVNIILPGTTAPGLSRWSTGGAHEGFLMLVSPIRARALCVSAAITREQHSSDADGAADFTADVEGAVARETGMPRDAGCAVGAATPRYSLVLPARAAFSCRGGSEMWLDGEGARAHPKGCATRRKAESRCGC